MLPFLISIGDVDGKIEARIQRLGITHLGGTGR